MNVLWDYSLFNTIKCGFWWICSTNHFCVKTWAIFNHHSLSWLQIQSFLLLLEICSTYNVQCTVKNKVGTNGKQMSVETTLNLHAILFVARFIVSHIIYFFFYFIVFDIYNQKLSNTLLCTVDSIIYCMVSSHIVLWTHRLKPSVITQQIEPRWCVIIHFNFPL